MADKKKKDRIMTPTGRANYPWVNKPDTKFKKNGEYSCGVVLDKHDPETTAIIDKLTALRTEMVEELKAGRFMWMGSPVKLKPFQIKALNMHPVYTDLVDDETGEPTGEIVIKAKQNAIFGKNDEYKANIVIVNSKGEPTSDLNVFGGDTIKMLFTPAGFWKADDLLFGLTLRLVAVQVIASNGAGGADLGFGDEGDGALGFPSQEGSPSDDLDDDDVVDAPQGDF